MENAREEWDRAHALGSKTRMSLNEYKELLRGVGEAVCYAAMVEEIKAAPSFTELEDNDGICEMLEETIVVEEAELIPLVDEEGLPY